jgi:hypothetical protein
MRSEGQRAESRRPAKRSTGSLWTSFVALLVVVLLILFLSQSEQPRALSKGIAAVAALLLLIRLLSRRFSKGREPRAARPDPESRIKLS